MLLAPKIDPDSIDGEWNTRWNSISASPPSGWVNYSATIKTKCDCVYILIYDSFENPDYLIKASLDENNVLVGKFMSLTDLTYSSPWVGKIVNPERIDGQWEGGRWDFRRKL